MRLALACPFYGPTPPIVGDGQRANMVNAVEAGHEWMDDYSVSGTQHRNACEVMAFKAAHDPRIDAVFWTEHDVLLPPFAVVQLCETLEKMPEADVVTGIAFRRGEPYNPMVARLDPESLTPERYEEMKTSNDHQARRAAHLMSYEEMKSKVLMSITTVDTTAPPFQTDTASMCCLLFRKSVFEKVWEVPDLFAVDPMGFFSVDNAFFLRLRERGFKLFCDPRVLCGHLGDPEIITWETWRKHSLKVAEKLDLKRQEKLRAEDNEARIYGELTRLANKHGTDKGTLDHTPDSGWQGWIHNYCDFYESQLAPMRLSAKRVLEIGVWKGASLKMWRDYFPNAVIHGLDDWSQVEQKLGELGERIVIHEGNQSDRADLARVVEETGQPFDLIVDDGGHSMEQQQTSLGALFPSLRPGGSYIVEDLHSSFMGEAFGVDPDRSNATLELLESLANGRQIKSRYMTAEELKGLAAGVESCTIYGRKSLTAVLRKKA